MNPSKWDDNKSQKVRNHVPEDKNIQKIWKWDIKVSHCQRIQIFGNINGLQFESLITHRKAIQKILVYHEENQMNPKRDSHSSR